MNLKQKMKSLAEHSILEIGFSVRVLNALINYDIRTIGQLLTWSAEDLERYRPDLAHDHAYSCRYRRTGLGKVSIRDLEATLAELGLNMRPVKNPYVKPHQQRLVFANVNCLGGAKPGLSEIWEMRRMNKLISDKKEENS